MDKSSDYFSLFSIPVSFEIDLAELTQRYLKLQKAVHPDKFANSSEQERLYSVQQTAKLNDAYDTLKKPLLRARYMLELHDVSLNHDNTTIKDTSFLMQQMELRESIEKKKSDIDGLEESLDHIDDLYGAELKEIKKHFAVDEPDYLQLADRVRKLQFFSKLREEVDSLVLQLSNN